jgi:hypothetical protein
MSSLLQSRIVIMQELLKELKIEYKTHQTYHNAIEADPMVLQLRYLNHWFYYCNDVIFSPCFSKFVSVSQECFIGV